MDETKKGKRNGMIKKIILYALVFAFCAIDTTVLYGRIDPFYDSSSAYAVAIQAVSMGFLLDFPLFAFSGVLCKYRVGLGKLSKTIIAGIMSILCFMLVYIPYAAVTLSSSDIFFINPEVGSADDDVAPVNDVGLAESAEVNAAADSKAAETAAELEGEKARKSFGAWIMLVPLATSIGSFVLGFAYSSPVVDEIEKYEHKKQCLDEKIIKTQEKLAISDDKVQWVVEELSEEEVNFTTHVSEVEIKAIEAAQRSIMKNAQNLGDRERIRALEMAKAVRLNIKKPAFSNDIITLLLQKYKDGSDGDDDLSDLAAKYGDLNMAGNSSDGDSKNDAPAVEETHENYDSDALYDIIPGGGSDNGSNNDAPVTEEETPEEYGIDVPYDGDVPYDNYVPYIGDKEFPEKPRPLQEKPEDGDTPDSADNT